MQIHDFGAGDIRLQTGVHTLNSVDGTPGDDQLAGTGGDDVINGLDGNDNLFGLGGADTLNGGEGVDFLSGSSGNDQCYGDAGDDFIKGGDGDDRFDGGDGYDRAGFLGALNPVHVDLRLQGAAQDTGQGMDTLVSIEMLSGTEMNDVLIGDNKDNVLIGSGGDDSLVGGGGDDLVALAYGGSMTVNGGDGVDTLQVDSNTQDGLFTSSVLSLAVSGAQTSEAGTFKLKDIENLSGSMHDQSNDVFTGDGANNILAGALADDRLTGGGGDDLLLGDGLIHANFGALGLSGPQELLLEGVGSGGDRLDGGLGVDTLVGGGGADSLRGGAGKDVFQFLSVSDSNAETGLDVISDLTRKDVIDLSGIDADVAADGDQAFDLVGHFHNRAGELNRSYDSESNVTTFSADVDGDGQADLQFQARGDLHAFTNFVL